MALILLYTFKTSIMSFELFVLQVFFLSMAGLILYMNRNMLKKQQLLSFFKRNKTA